MKKIYMDDWYDKDAENIKIVEKIVDNIFNTFGGGMGGGYKNYYAETIKPSKTFGENYITINMFGQEIELNLAHIVEIKKVKIIECYHSIKNEFRVYKIGNPKTKYEVNYGYNTNCNEDRIYGEFDYEQ